MRTGEPMLRSLVSLAVVGSLMVAGPALQAVASPQRTQPVKGHWFLPMGGRETCPWAVT